MSVWPEELIETPPGMNLSITEIAWQGLAVRRCRA
jgi:hypothetical protein